MGEDNLYVQWSHTTSAVCHYRVLMTNGTLNKRKQVVSAACRDGTQGANMAKQIFFILIYEGARK